MTETPPRLFDRTARSRVGQALDADALFLVDEVAERLLERLDDIPRPLSRVLEIEPRSARIAERLAGSGYEAGNLDHDETVHAGPEGSYDLVISNLALHAVNDPVGILIQANRLLKPDGLLLVSLFAGETLGALRTAWLMAESAHRSGVSPRVAPFADLRDLGGLLQRAEFALPVADLDSITVDFATPIDLMRDLKAMGEGNCLAARARGLVTPALLAAAAAYYPDMGADGRCLARFDIAFLTGFAPHPDQPKPKRPGSATHSLAEALGTTENRLQGDTYELPRI